MSEIAETQTAWEHTLVAYKRADLIVETPREPIDTPRDTIEASWPELLAAEGGYTVGFRGVSGGLPYRTDDTAHCARRENHPPLTENCTCGFYGLTNRDKIITSHFAGGTNTRANSAVLTVYLYGDVIEGSLGMRATHQKVAVVEVQNKCARCHSRDVTHVAQGELADITLRSEIHYLDQVCAACAQQADGHVFTLDQLEDELGVEVRVLERQKSWAQRTLDAVKDPQKLRNTVKRTTTTPLAAGTLLFLVAQTAILSRAGAAVWGTLVAAAVAFVAAAALRRQRHWQTVLSLNIGITLLVAQLAGALTIPTATTPNPRSLAHKVAQTLMTEIRTRPHLGVDGAEAAADALEKTKIVEAATKLGEVAVVWHPDTDPNVGQIWGVVSTPADDDPQSGCYHLLFSSVGDIPQTSLIQGPRQDGACTAGQLTQLRIAWPPTSAP